MCIRRSDACARCAPRRGNPSCETRVRPPLSPLPSQPSSLLLPPRLRRNRLHRNRLSASVEQIAFFNALFLGVSVCMQSKRITWPRKHITWPRKLTHPFTCHVNGLRGHVNGLRGHVIHLREAHVIAHVNELREDYIRFSSYVAITCKQ